MPLSGEKRDAITGHPPEPARLTLDLTVFFIIIRVTMKKSLLTHIAVVIAFGALCFSQASAGLQASANAPELFFSKTILSNGMEVIVRENHAHPVVTIEVTVKTGLSTEGRYAGSGISHFIEHMIFKGTASRKPGDIETEVKSYGGSVNAWTGLDSTVFSITVPSEYAKEALELMEDMVFRPAFNRQEMEKEREVILKEINMNRDDPARRVMRQLWETAYLEHPYKMPIIGYEDLFKDLKREDLVKYHSLRYLPENCIVTVVGDVNEADTLPAIKTLFEKYKRTAGTPQAVPREPDQNSERLIESTAEINLGYLALAYHTTGLSDKDLYALDVLAILLGEWDESRLNKRVVKKDELLYTVSAFNYTPKYPGLFIVYGIGDWEKFDGAKRSILEEIAKIAAGDISSGELTAAKNLVISAYVDSLETTGGLARNMSQGAFLAGDPDFFKNYVEKVKILDKDAVSAAAARYLTMSNLTVSRLYPESSPDDTGDTGGKEKKAPSRPEKVILPNGIRLVLKANRSLPKISLVCAFLGGTAVETDQTNGISNLTSAMMLKGTSTRDESRITGFIEGMGGKIKHFSGKNSFGLSMEFLCDDDTEALDLLEDVIKNPTFPGKELAKEKEKIYAAITRQDDDVFSAGFLKLRKELFENYTYALRVAGEKDSVAKIRRVDLVGFHSRFCTAGNMVISVVGDFDIGNMKREIEKRFSAMDAAPLRVEPSEPPPLDGINKVSFDMSREQSLIVIGFRGADINSPDNCVLQVLASVLSGENGRLYYAVRNSLGLSYALGTISLPGRETGYFASYAATDLENLEKTKNVLFNELRKVGHGTVAEKDVRLAKSVLVGRQKISLQLFGGLAYRMALDELYGRGYDFYLSYPGRISEITRENVIAAGKKYITMENCAIVTVFGEKE